jgi:hypothetical protein
VSYDLYLLRKDDIGDDPAGAYERLEGLEDRVPTQAEEAQLRRLVADLRAANPRLDVSEPLVGFMLQLGYDNEQPVVIDISADEVSMSWSYGADDPEPALTQVELYLPVFDRHGYVAYDPQLDCLFDPDRDRADAADVHTETRALTFGKYGVSLDARPWWKRLFGIH